MNCPREFIDSLQNGGLGLYSHSSGGGVRHFLVLIPQLANDESLASFLEQGRHPQAFVNTEAWEGEEGPTNEVYGMGKVLPVDYNAEGLRSLSEKLVRWQLVDLRGWDRMVVRSFPRGDVLVHGGVEALLLEATSHADEMLRLLFVSELHSSACRKITLDKQAYLDEFNLMSLTQEEVVESRMDNPRLVSHTGEIETPLRMGDFKVHSFYSAVDRRYHWAFATKGIHENRHEIPLIRIESECLTGHVFGSLLCDCGRQLELGLEKVQEHGYGALIYLRQEGRGIGLVNKLKAYRLQQEEKMDTVDANLAIGAPEDARDYLIGALMLKHFGISKIKLLTNNPAKVAGLEKHGIEVVERVSHVIPPSEHNARYLSTKKQRMGHLI
jgi:GTP cyclohydrolase II